NARAVDQRPLVEPDRRAPAPGVNLARVGQTRRSIEYMMGPFGRLNRRAKETMAAPPCLVPQPSHSLTCSRRARTDGPWASSGMATVYHRTQGARGFPDIVRPASALGSLLEHCNAPLLCGAEDAFAHLGKREFDLVMHRAVSVSSSFGG